jgi:hypothetical protein
MRAPRGREGLPRSPLFYETNSASSICPGQNGTSSFADGRRRGDRPLGGFASGSTVEGAGVVAGGRLLALAVRGFFSIRFLKPARREVKVHDPVALALGWRVPRLSAAHLSGYSSASNQRAVAGSDLDRSWRRANMTKLLAHCFRVRRTVASVEIKDGIVFAEDQSRFCIDVWKPLQRLPPRGS